MKERSCVPFDKEYFANKKRSGEKLSTPEKFEFIYKTNFWSGQISVSGEGSDDQQTRKIKEILPEVIEHYRINKMIDLPCGDFNWMRKIDLKLDEYVGADIVDEIISLNTKKYSTDKISFKKLDIIKDDLPNADMIFCRDCLVHFSYYDIFESLKNIKKNNIAYLMTTTFIECDSNENIETGDWRIINLQKAPFNFPEPLLIINENCTEGNGTYSDKSLGLWKVSDLII